MTFPNWHIHLSYVVVGLVLAVGSYVGVKSFVAEHDARVAAENQIKVNEATVKSLQQQIADRDAQAAKQQQVIVKVVHDVKTAPQAAAALPQVVNQPLPAPVEAQPNGSWLVPQPDVLPVFQQLADDKICRSELSTAQADLTDTKAVVAAKDAEIVALKKKPKFWHRVGSTMKKVGIGVGIGALIALIH
jgi:hypothetical protein